jgi:hypothetical protein
MRLKASMRLPMHPAMHPPPRVCAAVHARSVAAMATPDKFDYEIFTIGAGSGGVRCSRIASGYGAQGRAAWLGGPHAHLPARAHAHTHRHTLPAPTPCAGAKVAVCELPFEFISSETAGGVGGTCVLRCAVLRGCSCGCAALHCVVLRCAVLRCAVYCAGGPPSQGGGCGC